MKLINWSKHKFKSVTWWHNHFFYMEMYHSNNQNYRFLFLDFLQYGSNCSGRICNKKQMALKSQLEAANVKGDHPVTGSSSFKLSLLSIISKDSSCDQPTLPVSKATWIGSLPWSSRTITDNGNIVHAWLHCCGTCLMTLWWMGIFLKAGERALCITSQVLLALNVDDRLSSAVFVDSASSSSSLSTFDIAKSPPILSSSGLYDIDLQSKYSKIKSVSWQLSTVGTLIREW